MKKALLIPSYQPNQNVLPFLKQFKNGDFDAFLLVDDGSGEHYSAIFDAVSKETPFEVFSYAINKGKGHALKTGARYLLDKYPDIELIVTADSDGQHLREDILKVADAAEENYSGLTLGVRNFDDKNVPKRSRAGNRFSAFYFRLATGKKLHDTQTGLRAVSKEMFPLLLNTPGDRYEFEMNFLMEAARNYPLETVGITTVYEENNKGSHFHVVKDSLRIYKTPLLYVLVSILSWVIDEGFFYLFSTYVFTEAPWQVYGSAGAARLLSGTFNFLMFAFVVFPHKGDLWNKLWKYLIVFSINLMLSAELTYLFSGLPAHLTFIKVVVDIVLAIVNYFVNLAFTFSGKRRKRKKEKEAQHE